MESGAAPMIGLLFVALMGLAPIGSAAAGELTGWQDLHPNLLTPAQDGCFVSDKVGCIVADQVYRTADGGRTWTGVCTQYASRVAFANAQVGYAAGGGWATPPGYVLKTADGGLTWTKVFDAPLGLYALAVGDADHVVVGSSWNLRTVWWTADGGKTWQAAAGAGGDIGSLVAASATEYYALNLTGQVAHSRDGGKTWEQGATVNKTAHRTRLALMPDGTLLVSGATEGGILASSDGGRTFHPLTDSPDIEFPTGAIRAGADGRIMLACNGGIWQSDDRGKTWRKTFANPGITTFQELNGVWYAFGGSGRPAFWTAVLLRNSVHREIPSGIVMPVTLHTDGIVCCNIRDGQGATIRTLTDEHVGGSGWALRWDGKDRFGRYVQPGEYRFEALNAPALQARYIGAVGSSGTPPYETADGRGGWGSDMAYPNGVACDTTGIYFVWSMSDASGCTVVKIDHAGKTLWRVRPPAPGNGFGNYCGAASTSNRLYLLSGAGPSIVPTVMCMDINSGGQISPRPLELSTNTVKDQVGFVAPGIALAGNRGYASLYYENRIRVFDLGTMAIVAELALERPHGLYAAPNGDLYAISRGSSNAASRIVRFEGGRGEARDFITQGLDLPAHLARFSDGSFVVTDPGASSHQVKIFSADGTKLLRTLGRAGGRPWMGRYKAGDFLRPWGVTVLADDSFVVVEHAPPGVITLLSKKGHVLKQWFGPGAYGTPCFVDPDRPFTVFYALWDGTSGLSMNALARGTINEKTGAWSGPEAYWSLNMVGWHTNAFEYYGALGDLFALNVEHRKYIVQNGSWLGCNIVEIKGDRLLPVMSVVPRASGSQIVSYASSRQGHVLQETSPTIPLLHTWLDVYCHDNLDLYYYTGRTNRTILMVPFQGIDERGFHRWDTARIRTVIPDIAPGTDMREVGGDRRGVCGMRMDRQGNLYVAWAAGPTSRGLFWSAFITYARLSKYDPSGSLVWEVGTKAMAKRQDGEIYNWWTMGGLFDEDRYLAVGDETGIVHYFTTDGFYRGHILKDLAEGDRDAYTGSCESESQGLTIRDRKTGKYYAYRGSNTAACMYEVTGFGGETRTNGTVTISADDLAKLALDPR